MYQELRQLWVRQLTPDVFTALRKSMGHTQHSLAVALRMGKSGHQTVSDWERGLRPIPGPVQIAMDHLANCRGVVAHRHLECE